MDLKSVTQKLVKEYIEKFEKNERYYLADQAIIKLIDRFPNNVDLEEILLKITVINKLYSTNLSNNEVLGMAKNVLKLKIDDLIANEDTEIVGKIAKLEKNHYSFATKYCNWHNQSGYPIYDSFVEKVLIAYQKEYKFYKKSEEIVVHGLSPLDLFKAVLKDYKGFKDITDEFKKYYKINVFNYKEIDKFLWMYGKELFK